jgi:hypothetical protein
MEPQVLATKGMQAVLGGAYYLCETMPGPFSQKYTVANSTAAAETYVPYQWVSVR